MKIRTGYGKCCGRGARRGGRLGAGGRFGVRAGTPMSASTSVATRPDARLAPRPVGDERQHATSIPASVRYDAKAKVLTGSLLLDWSPLGPFRISGGFMPNKNKIDLTGQPTRRHAPFPRAAA